MKKLADDLKKLTISLEPIETIKLNPKNPRKNEETTDEIIKSINAFGYVDPIIVRKADRTIIAGNNRYKALQKLKAGFVPVIFADLSEIDADVLMVTHNKLTEKTPWDFPKLADLFVEFDQLNVEMDLTGFDEQEIKDIVIGPIDLTPNEKDDVIPEPPPEPITKKGDLWLLGEHRLLCGDSTKKADVERLMASEKADMVFTDPPYGACISGMMLAVHGKQSPINRTRRWEQIKGDEQEDEKLQAFLELAFKNVSEVAKDNAPWYIWHAMLTQGFFSAAAAAAANLILNRQIIWVKPVLILAFGDYHWRHELCFYGWKKGNKPEFYGPTNETTVWEVDFDGKMRMPNTERQHPTQKPVGLAARALQNSSLVGGICIDAFLGSGTTLIACEKLKRRCYGMEIDPKYCDVIVKRWEDYTGKTAELEE